MRLNRNDCADLSAVKTQEGARDAAEGVRVLEKPEYRFQDPVNLEAVPGEATQAWKPTYTLALPLVN